MKPYRIAVLYLLFVVANYYGCKFAFMGMTAAHDLTFWGGLLLLVLLVITDIKFVLWRLHKATQPAVPQEKENNNA